MPTGYTDKVANGRITTFRQFALLCSQAFGVKFTNEDESIPSEFDLEDHYDKLILRSRSRLALLESMSPIDAQREMQQEHSTRMHQWRQEVKEQAYIRLRYEKMRQSVLYWLPPTSKHISIKKFMLEQLDESIRFDCHAEYIRMPTLSRWPEWLQQKKSKCQNDIRDYQQRKAESDVNLLSRRAWVQDLKDSLPNEKAPLIYGLFD